MISPGEKTAALRARIERLAPLPDAEWRHLLALLSPRTLGAGETFVREGEEAREIGFILRGLVKDSYLTEDGREFVKEFENEGCFVGPYSALLTDRVSRFSIVALEPTELLVMPLDSMESLFRRSLEWQTFGRKLAEHLFLQRERRERELLIEDATKRYASFVAEYEEVAERIPQKEIAAYLGITPVSFSRLKRQG